MSDKIAIIGGSGFIGSYLLSEISGNKNVINIDKNESAQHANITVKGNVMDEQSISPLLKEKDCVVLLAAEHKDDVSPTSLYYDVNVDGAKNVLNAMEVQGVNKIVFTSSVAVYGLNKDNPDENFPVDPFNHYGKSKYQAEDVLRAWYNKDPQQRTLVIIRPTVVFGPNNRGNVYNLLKQLSSGRFMKIGSGKNVKSMAYVQNVVAFLEYCINNFNEPGYHVFNYVDKPDLSMNQLIRVSEESIGKKVPKIAIPYFIGYIGGLGLDVIAKITKKKFPISAVRVKKFCATTTFSSTNIKQTNFTAPYSLSEGLDKTIKSILNTN